MNTKNINLLRSLVREIVTEAPYRSSGVVTLRSVQGTGISLGTAAVATGVAVLASTYSWLTNLCPMHNTNFPIKLSKAAKEKLESAAKSKKALNLHANNGAWEEYQATLLESGVNNATSQTSDFAANYDLYSRAKALPPQWPPSRRWIDLELSQRRDIHAKMVSLMELYTGCDASFLHGKLGKPDDDSALQQTFPFKDRSSMITFLQDMVNDAHNSFKTGVGNQRDNLVLVFTSTKDSSLIKKVCDGKISADAKNRDSAIRNLK